MSPANVVVSNVIADLDPGCHNIVIFFHFEFGLDGAEAGFHEGVVVAIIGLECIDKAVDLGYPRRLKMAKAFFNMAFSSSKSVIRLANHRLCLTELFKPPFPEKDSSGSSR